ncbi:hypothetical protein [Sphingomonas sp.]|uniref:hypothetical protein n=1 Tax=Sphingomonas sp. TaxID=28214 RepID=UPI0031CF1926
MGKKKHKKKQKKAAKADNAGPAMASPLHRIGQTLLDQARSPLGRQVIAAGLVVAASALARDAARPASGESEPHQPGNEEDSVAPVESQPTSPGATSSAAATSGASRDLPDVAGLAGLALSALDHFIHRKAPTDKA